MDRVQTSLGRLSHRLHLTCDPVAYFAIKKTEMHPQMSLFTEICEDTLCFSVVSTARCGCMRIILSVLEEVL